MPAPIQTATQAPPAPPSPPTPPATSAAGGFPEVFTKVPTTSEELVALRAQRSEVSSQLTSALRRRSDLATQMENASAAERPGLEARIQQLDGRILELESQLARAGQLISATPGQILTATSNNNSGPFNNMRPDVTAISIVLTIFVLSPLAIAAARLLWKRATTPPPAIDKEMADRLRRLEAGVDSIALEVERISEGQRFVTRLMAEREKVRIEPPRE
jgi:hypothetical protein